MIGYIADPDQVVARVVVDQSDIDQVRRQSQMIEVRLSSRPGETHAARLIRELPQATEEEELTEHLSKEVQPNFYAEAKGAF